MIHFGLLTPVTEGVGRGLLCERLAGIMENDSY